LVTVAASLAYMFAGSKLWGRHPRSKSLSFGELVLWSWARRRRAEGTLKRGADLLDDEIGRFLNPEGRRGQIKVLRELNAALEVRDPYTRGHSRRVERHAHRIALAMRCSDDDIFDIRLAASLHDVGKIKVPDRILRKDGPLDQSEWAIMKQHSGVGAELLERLGNQGVVVAVRSHHERWDGCGYPDGLMGTQTPLGARIIAVADTFDAITSCRPYRSRSDRAHAIAVLKAEAGRQFDPAVVSAFLSTAPHHAAALAGAAAFVAPFARGLASQWGVVFNKVGAVGLAGTMAASAVTGVATVERPWEKRGDRAQAHAPAEPKRDREDGAADPGSPGRSPSPSGNAFGHSKKAHEGGNGKSHAGGNGKSRAEKSSPPDDEAPKKEKAKDEQSHAGGRGKSQGAAHSSSPNKLDDGTKVKSKPDKDADAPAVDATAPAPASEPPKTKPAKPKDEATAPEPVEEPVVEEPVAAAPEAPSSATGKGKDKAK
jgi:hypothetical protein